MYIKWSPWKKLKKCNQKVQATLPNLAKFQPNQVWGHSNIQKSLYAANMNMKSSSNKSGWETMLKSPVENIL